VAVSSICTAILPATAHAFRHHYQELTHSKNTAAPAQLLRRRQEWNDDIVFVRRVVPGAADRSYDSGGASRGLPLSVIDRAKLILGKLESDDTESNFRPAAPQEKADGEAGGRRTTRLVVTPVWPERWS